jgi:hypothetical protein
LGEAAAQREVPTVFQAPKIGRNIALAFAPGPSLAITGVIIERLDNPGFPFLLIRPMPMPLFYCSPRFALCTGLLLAPVSAALGQAPIITTISPMANAQAASRTGPLTVGFSQLLAASSAGALRVFSNQRGGLRTRGTTPAVVRGNALSFTPTAMPFTPGETVQYTVTAAAANSSGALVLPRVGQFTTAVGGTGRGNFQLGSDIPMSEEPSTLITGDIDGDGDLDLIVMTEAHSITELTQVRLLLNNGRGTFSNGQTIDQNTSARLALSDVDGDGDLDLLATNAPHNAVNIYLNNGYGRFSTAPSVSVGINPTDIAVGDVDADGDLDVLTTSNGTPPLGMVSVRLNNGSGTFSASQEVRVGSYPHNLQLADMNGDGSLDILTAAGIGLNAALCLRANNGHGTFGISYNPTINANYNLPGILAFLPPTDLDSDGDLDLLATAYDNTVSMYVNDGVGMLRFDHYDRIGNSYASYYKVITGDVDNDGDPDVVAVGNDGLGSNISLNNGSGRFTVSNKSAALDYCRYLTLADVDGDGDLDLLAASSIIGISDKLVSVRLNGGTDPPVITNQPAGPTDLALFPSPARDHATLIGAIPNSQFTVLDVLGRTVLTDVTGNDGTAQLVLPNQLAGGLYLVRTSGHTLRLVVE